MSFVLIPFGKKSFDFIYCFFFFWRKILFPMTLMVHSSSSSCLRRAAVLFAVNFVIKWILFNFSEHSINLTMFPCLGSRRMCKVISFKFNFADAISKISDNQGVRQCEAASNVCHSKQRFDSVNDFTKFLNHIVKCQFVRKQKIFICLFHSFLTRMFYHIKNHQFSWKMFF